MKVDPIMPGKAPRRQRRGTAEHLRTALSALAGGQATIASHTQQSWASITFSGTRHTVTMLFESEAAMAAGEAFIDRLAEHEFTIPGQLVADAAIRSVDHALVPAGRMAVTAELLLLEES